MFWGLRAEEGGDRERQKTAALLGGWVAFRRRRANFGWFWQRILNCTSVFVLSRKVCPCRSRFRFSLFLPASAFLLRSSKRLGCSWLGQGFQCSGNGRVSKFACREDAIKARNVGHTKATKLNLRTKQSLLQQNPLFTFFEKRKSAWFSGGKERSRREMVSFVYFNRAGAQRRDRSRLGKKHQKIGPVVCAFRAMLT